MMKKIPVQLNPYIKTRQAYEKLKICRSCGRFTILGYKTCPSCGKSSLIKLEKKALSLQRSSIVKETILILALVAAGIFFSESTLQTSLCAAGGVTSLALLWMMRRSTRAERISFQLGKLLQRESFKLVDGLRLDREAAIAVFHNGEKQRAYEMLREIGTLVRTDQIKVEQILLLQSFVLRKDMDLMLEPLLLDHFNPDLVQYMGELAKLNRGLLKEKAFRYALIHEAQILRMKGGEPILVGIAGAAVRLKRYVILYPHLVMRYARKLPKDRFLRLYNVIRNNPQHNWGALGAEVSEIYNEKYKWDTQ
ncbi:hypothetical protein [Paenibacillus sp. KS-LC4]|uniref:hypothetical protein n=1 Tax=Paenibacillus sp. KS-LC4 TaxID=2979727 RepID=UPI0030CFC655